MSAYQHIDVAPLTPFVGAEVSGVDFSRPLPVGQIADINRAYTELGVLVFRGQSLTPEQHIAAARQFGDINVNRFFRPVDGYPEIAEVRKEPHQKINIGGLWHTDHSYDQLPAKASLLYARELPPIGGDTLFSSVYAAYDTLSDGLKRTLDGLKAVHSSRHTFGYGSRADTEPDLKGRLLNHDQATQDAEHPVAITHPETGRKALFVNPNFTTRFVGWTAEESKPLLDFLYAHIQRPEFIARVRWEPGTLAFWDNRATWHLALNNYAGSRRVLHRITLEGGPLN
jgi:taurine dioxygenase